MSFIEVSQGNSPLILAFPHTGILVPDEIRARLNPNGQMLADTDWNLHKLYENLGQDVTRVRTLIHRYVIDCNRDPSGESLYPGQNTTNLVPLTDFDGKAIYISEPDHDDIQRVKEQFHQPYHERLQAEIERVKSRHGFAILYDCHSIRSKIPFLFEGILPDFNIGTNSGATSDPEIENIVTKICASANGYTHVVNGRFKGGWTTRHYGQRDKGIHAIQMELAQSTYMHEQAPWDYHAYQAEMIRTHLDQILTQLIAWRPS